MIKSDQNIFTPVNDPIKAETKVISWIEIQGFHKLLDEGKVSTIQVFYERVAQEIYNTRKKNYSWGFGVIEPEIQCISDRIILSSKLYMEEDLADLNSVVFKLFTEFNNLILSTALHMHLPVKGIIGMGDCFHGSLQSRKPALVSGQEPLILRDLLKVFSFGEIFPRGFSSGMIPAVELPFQFGSGLSQMETDLQNIEAVGIFMPSEHMKEAATEVTLLSNMMCEIEVQGKKFFACNWKEWMNEYSTCSSENVLAFAEAAGKDSKEPLSKHWKSLVAYSVHL